MASSFSSQTRISAAGEGGAVRWDPGDYHAQASAQTGWGREVHARLQLRGDETLFDLGCGDGRLTAELAARVPAGRVVGFDADGEMIAFARRAYPLPHVEFLQADVRTFSHARRADWIVSTACLHWVAEHEQVLRRCRAHLEPGGRILFQMGGAGNCGEFMAAAEATAAAPAWKPCFAAYTTPWRYCSPENYRAWAPRNGFRLIRAELVPKDMVHDGPEGLAGWMRTTWMPVLARVPAERRAEFIRAVVDRYLRIRPLDERGRTHVPMVRLEVEAVAV